MIDSRSTYSFPEISSRAKSFSRARARVSETVDFSLFTPIRRPYYLRAVDTVPSISQDPADGLQIAGMQMRFLSSRLLEMLFTPPPAARREKCIRNRRDAGEKGVVVCSIRCTPSQKRRFKYKVNYILARFHQR